MIVLRLRGKRIKLLAHVTSRIERISSSSRTRARMETALDGNPRERKSLETSGPSVRSTLARATCAISHPIPHSRVSSPSGSAATRRTWLAGTTVKRIDRSMRRLAQTTNRRSPLRPPLTWTKCAPRLPARLPYRPSEGFLLTKYQCYRPRNYVFRTWRWSVYIGGTTDGPAAVCQVETSGDHPCAGQEERLGGRGKEESVGLAKGALVERPEVMMFV